MEAATMYSKKILDGYRYITVNYDRNLKYCPYGSTGVDIYRDGTIALISYTTRVIEINKAGYLTCTGTYSATTRKHIRAFLKEYAPALCYADIKPIAGTEQKINIWTGERD